MSITHGYTCPLHMDTHEYSLLHVNTLSITGKYILPERIQTMENGQTLVRYQSNSG
jgi:hypothetical protein